MNKISQEQATQSVELLIEGLHDLEKRLVADGFEAREAGYWLFHIREMLGDWREIVQQLTTLCNTDDLSQVPALLNNFSTYMNYSFAVHTPGHMEALEKMMNKRFPENLDDFDAENNNES